MIDDYHIIRWYIMENYQVNRNAKISLHDFTGSRLSRPIIQFLKYYGFDYPLTEEQEVLFKLRYL